MLRDVETAWPTKYGWIQNRGMADEDMRRYFFVASRWAEGALKEVAPWRQSVPCPSALVCCPGTPWSARVQDEQHEAFTLTHSCMPEHDLHEDVFLNLPATRCCAVGTRSQDTCTMPSISVEWARRRQKALFFFWPTWKGGHTCRVGH